MGLARWCHHDNWPDFLIFILTLWFCLLIFYSLIHSNHSASDRTTIYAALTTSASWVCIKKAKQIKLADKSYLIDSYILSYWGETYQCCSNFWFYCAYDVNFVLLWKTYPVALCLMFVFGKLFSALYVDQHAIVCVWEFPLLECLYLSPFMSSAKPTLLSFSDKTKRLTELKSPCHYPTKYKNNKETDLKNL